MKSQKFIHALVLFLIVLTGVSFAAPKLKQKPKENPKTTKLVWHKPAFPKLDHTREGQICFAMYALHKNTLKMTVQLYPLQDGDGRKVSLEVKKMFGWKKVAEGTVRENAYGSPENAKAWNLLFRVEDWDDSKDWKYRVVALDGVATYEGIIRKNPVDKEEIVVAAFTGNSNKDRAQKPDIIKNIKAQDPDLLFFSGDQSYDHRDHLYAWLLFGRQFGEIIKDRPTVCIPDDHDVGQGNIWGASGKKASTGAGDDGGYFMPVQYVKEVEFAQTANLPDPYDPTPVLRGIGVYYTSLNIGGVDFAIIEDRKFKSGPNGLVPKMGPRPDHILDPKYDPKSVDVKGAVLLGERQLKFLEEWGKDWKGAEIKSVLSQTVFANAAHCHGGFKNRLHADMDSNGWPQTGRKKALQAIRKSFSFMIGGDQHLATIIHHGTDEFKDSGWSFCVPSIVNYYNRWWHPLEKPERPIKTPLEFTGDYYDGFKNKLSMYAYSNPGDHMYITESKHVSRAAGHGIIRFNKKTRQITMECWPRGADVTAKDTTQYPGWPKTITQEENYGRKAVAYLPTLKVVGMEDPVVQVIEEATGKVVYTLRINGNTWRPKVFAEGKYTVIVGDQGKRTKTIKGVVVSNKKEELKISL